MVQCGLSAAFRCYGRLRSQGYVLLPAAAAARRCKLDVPALEALRNSWEHLPPDTYLRDGGHYRARRHGCFVQTLGARWPSWRTARTGNPPLQRAARRTGPLVRADRAGVSALAAWRQLLAAIGELFAALRPVTRWYLEAHQFRIDTAKGIGRPTPEGAHRDGVDFVAVVLVRRQVQRR